MMVNFMLCLFYHNKQANAASLQFLKLKTTCLKIRVARRGMSWSPSSPAADDTASAGPNGQEPPHLLPCGSPRKGVGPHHWMKNREKLFVIQKCSLPNSNLTFSIPLELTSYISNPHSLHWFTCENVPNSLLKSGVGRLK